MSILVKALVNNYGMLEAHLKVDNRLHEKIDIDRAVKYLYENHKLFSSDIAVLREWGTGTSINVAAQSLGMSRWKYNKVLNHACHEIATFLGWEYSNAYLYARAASRITDMTGDMIKALAEEVLKDG